MESPPDPVQRRFPIELALSLSFLPGFIAAVVAMWAAWTHNAQGEIHNHETGVDWAYWITIGATSFAAVSSIPALVVLALWIKWRRSHADTHGR